MNTLQQEKDLPSPIQSLPDEVLSIILGWSNLSCNDVLSFGATCTQFNEYIKRDHIVWKIKLKAILSPDVFYIINTNGENDFYEEAKSYFILRKSIYKELTLMSPRFYREYDLHLTDVLSFFILAQERSINYYLTIWILCDIVKRGNKYVDSNLAGQKPYTLTDVYYAKVVLRYLIHGFMMVRWIQMMNLNEMTPERIVYFFHQWTDSSNIHMFDDIEYKIDDIVEKVEALLDPAHPLKQCADLAARRQRWARCALPGSEWDPTACRQVLAAVAQVLFRQRRLTVTTAASLDTLDIVKTLDNRCGNSTAVAAVLEGAARRCGVRTELVVFPNHMFLEWRDSYVKGAPAESYIINLSTGALERKRQCPFSGARGGDQVQYHAHSLLQHLLRIFNESMGAIRNWSTQNVFHLLHFLGTDYMEHNPYKGVIAHLTERMAPATAPHVNSTKMDLEFVDDVFLDLISSIFTLNKPREYVKKERLVRRRENKIRYAVGMVCYHVKYEYVCVLRGWDAACSAPDEWQAGMAVRTLRRGADQPFYNVIAADYSERYVAQENLQELRAPSRLYHLEDVIAREFSHFDGFAYVPNDEKRADYPGDAAVREMFRARARLAAA